MNGDEVQSTLTANTNQTSVVQITCRVRGKPAPSVTWSKDDDVINMATSDDIYRVVDEREYRSDVHTWIVTSRLLLQGANRQVFPEPLGALGGAYLRFLAFTRFHCETTGTGLVHRAVCLFTPPAFAGTRCTYPRRDGQAELTRVE